MLEMCSKCNTHPGGHNKKAVSDLDGAHKDGHKSVGLVTQSYKKFPLVPCFLRKKSLLKSSSRRSWSQSYFQLKGIRS